MGCNCCWSPLRKMKIFGSDKQMEANASMKDRKNPGDGPARWGVHGVNDLALASRPPLPAMVVWGLPKAPHQTRTLLHPSHHAPDQEFNQGREASQHDLNDCQNEIPSSLSYDDRNSSSDYNNSPSLTPTIGRMIAMGAARDYSIQHCQSAPARRVTCNVPGDDERLTTMFSDENPHACSVS